jgi:hypothetical protein
VLYDGFMELSKHLVYLDKKMLTKGIAVIGGPLVCSSVHISQHNVLP